MSKRVLIVGAGVIGAAIALNATRRGLTAVVVDAVGPAAAASGASFGWINASFHLDDAHFQLRRESLEAYRRLSERTPALPVDWCGCLYADPDRAVLARLEATLAAQDYPVERLGRAGVIDRIPALAAPPDEALFFADEAATDAAALTSALLEAAIDAGATLLRGVAADAVIERGGAVRGVATAMGPIEADAVVVASGVGAPALLAPLGLTLPLAHRPSALIESAPLPPLLNCVLASATQELRQRPDGRMIAPGVAAHQSDAARAAPKDPQAVALASMARLAELFGLDAPVPWRSLALGRRPMPEDGRPAIGRWGPPGLLVAVMHSGVTLAAVVGEAVAAALDDRPSAADDRQGALLAPYAPERFDR